MKTPTLLRGNLKRRSQRGLTLVELMVAMTIGIFLVGAVGIIYVNTSTTSRSSTLESQMNEDAALALELLQQQIRLAGYSSVASDGTRQFSGIAVRGCDGGFAVAGTTADNDGTTAFSSLECKTGADADDDSLAVRYEATLLNSQEVTDSTGVKKPGNCIHEGITKWDASGAEGTGDVALADNRYYIADDGDVPSLFCKGRNGKDGKSDEFSAATALIPNVEDMQITYGVTAAPEANKAFPNQITAYVEASDTVLGATAENWSRVVAIRICLVARSANPVPLGDNRMAVVGEYKDCSGTTVSDKTDRYLRRAYVTTIQLRNMRPALPAPYEAPAGVVADPWRTLPAS